MPAAAREFLSSTKSALSPVECAWLENPRHHVVPFTDSRYPAALRRSSAFRLHCMSPATPTLLNDPQLAIVGSRNPTPQGRDTALEFAE